MTLNAQKLSFAQRYNTFLHAVLFVLGFSLVFIIGWGGAATILGQLFGQYKEIIGRLGGLVIIVFGLATLGVVRIPWLYYDTRPDFQMNPKRHRLSSLLMGVVLAAGWTPCIGTTLGAILTMSFVQETTAQAMILTSGYALGLGIPFLIIGLAMDRALTVVKWIRPHLRTIQIISGIFLIGIGLLLVSNRLIYIAIWAQGSGFYLDMPFTGAAPTYLIAVAAGLLSFLSPCVLPLVPAYVGYLSGQAFGISAAVDKSTTELDDAKI